MLRKGILVKGNQIGDDFSWGNSISHSLPRSPSMPFYHFLGGRVILKSTTEKSLILTSLLEDLAAYRTSKFYVFAPKLAGECSTSSCGLARKPLRCPFAEFGTGGSVLGVTHFLSFLFLGGRVLRKPLFTQTIW